MKQILITWMISIYYMPLFAQIEYVESIYLCDKKYFVHAVHTGDKLVLKLGTDNDADGNEDNPLLIVKQLKGKGVLSIQTQLLAQGQFYSALGQLKKFCTCSNDDKSSRTLEAFTNGFPERAINHLLGMPTTSIFLNLDETDKLTLLKTPNGYTISQSNRYRNGVSAKILDCNCKQKTFLFTDTNFSDTLKYHLDVLITLIRNIEDVDCRPIIELAEIRQDFRLFVYTGPYSAPPTNIVIPYRAYDKIIGNEHNRSVRDPVTSKAVTVRTYDINNTRK